MFFFVDESGHTGSNLFDEEQSILYYGVLSSNLNIDELATNAVDELRKCLGVDRLHAAELGMGRLVQISRDLMILQKAFDLHFDLYSVHKLDHAAISFFDQVFDQGMNPAVPWTSYWTPLRYILLLKVSALFDLELLKKSWNARIQHNDEYAVSELVDVCQTLLSRINSIYDERSRQIIRDTLTWAIQNPQELQYNTRNKRESNWITPNLIGFQAVIQGIALRIKEGISESPVIVVDQQSQFNKTQRSLAELYAEIKGLQFDFGTGLPEIDFTGMPETPILFKSGNESIGLELVDIYLWLFKRLSEGKEIAPELHPIIRYQINIGITNEISLNGIAKRWTQWFNNLPEPTLEQLETAKEMINSVEQRRVTAVAAHQQQKRLNVSSD